MKIDQKSIIIGFAIALVILLLAYFGFAVPFIGIYIAPLIAGAVTGYLVNRSNKMGMMHGTIVGAFSGIATVALIYLRIAGNVKLMGALLILAPWYLGSFIILGLLGGALGSWIKEKYAS